MSPLPLVLGTAQLGMPYGIANRTGMPDQDTATAIVRTAWENRIREFDTAQGYAKSEEVLGMALKKLQIAEQAKILTKIDSKSDATDADGMRRALGQSMERLGCRKLYGVMIHDESLLDHWDAGVGVAMQTILDEGIAENIGASVYSPAKATQAMEIDTLSMIQLPGNILDRRFEHAGVFEKAKQKGKQLYIRSIFLQGLILMNTDDLPPGMKHFSPVLQRIRSMADQAHLSRMELSLSFAQTAYPDSKMVIGAEAPEQVRQNALAFGHPMPESMVGTIRRTFPDIGEDILNPSLWLV